MGYKPKIGSDFPLEVRVIEANTRHTIEKTRSLIAATVLASSTVALAIVGVASTVSGDYTSLSYIWSVVAMPLGAVMAHYFGKAQTNDKDNHESSDRVA
ncbi:hypothetical protein [Litoreibacter halocynthiae]|uniref:hypothetical protein n=1 Tax=Litoreibacter halocynthiae TaxID=1242689 RepID=UPI002493160F|nr:hypothetical protein [Litoreibacter halocynthiae]